MHSKYSASGATRWLNCTGSIELGKDFPETTSKYAVEGTAAHEYMEKYLFKQHVVISETQRDQGFSEALDVWREHIWGILSNSNDCRIQIEKKITLEFIDADLYGTADCIILDHTNHTLHIIDFKYGKTKVDPDCAQLKYYALGACWQLPVDTIILTIVQPRLRNTTIDKVRSHTTNKAELKEFGLKMRDTLQDIKKGNTSLVPGQYCFFCKAKTICPEYKKKSNQSAIDDFKGV